MQEGVLNVADIDSVMSHGLGPRYAFMGPLETAHLNAEGTFSRFFEVCIFRSNKP